MAHHHACDRCGVKVPCDGTWERNHDGWPEVVCDLYHVREDEGVRYCEPCRRVLDDDWRAEQAAS